MRYRQLTFAFFLVVTSLIFLVVAHDRMMVYERSKTIDKAHLECIYQYKVKDALSRNEQEVELVLLVGKHLSKCCEMASYRRDTLVERLGNKKISVKKIFKMVKPGMESILVKWSYFQNYPEKGKTMITDQVQLDDYKSIMPQKQPNWTITNDIVSIAEYRCKKATTHFKGRDWTVWFTPTIKTTAGPWALCGLPGLIVKAVDSTQEHLIELHTLRKSNEPIVFLLRSYYTVPRKKVLSLQYNYAKDPANYWNGSAVYGKKKQEKKNKYPALFYNPLWLQD